MKIIADAFGGDNAPLEILKGCARAVRELNVEILLVGDEGKIKAVASENNISLENTEILQADEIFDICEDPQNIMTTGKKTSLAIGLKALREGSGDAFVSAGSTGALAFGSTFIVKRIRGIKRAAIAAVLPTAKGPLVLLDCGANSEARSEMLVQFAMMGSCYSEKVLGISSPRAALINIGSEPTKGRELEIEAYKLLQSAPINFTGNIEARQLPFGDCDVAIADGYTGNVTLKLYEGLGKFFSNEIKAMFGKSLKTKIGALFVLSGLKSFRKRMNYKEYGGAVLIGLTKPVIKAHGSSDETAFFNAIRQAKLCVEGDVCGKIKAYAEKNCNSSEKDV